MSIEKLTRQEIDSAKLQFEAEDKLPRTNQLLAELAEPYMEEALSLVGKSAEMPEESSDEQSAKLKRNIEVVKTNQAKLDALEDVDAYIQREIAKGLSAEQAQEKWMNAFLKHVKGAEDFNKLSEDELNKILEEEA